MVTKRGWIYKMPRRRSRNVRWKCKMTIDDMEVRCIDPSWSFMMVYRCVQPISKGWKNGGVCAFHSACLPGTLVHNSGEAVRGARMHSKISREVAIACFQLVTGVFLPCNLNNLTRCRLWKDCVILRDGVCRCVKVTLNQIARLLREQLKNVAWSSLALRLNGWRLCPQSICSTSRATFRMVPHGSALKRTSNLNLNVSACRYSGPLDPQTVMKAVRRSDMGSIERKWSHQGTEHC